MKTTLTIMNRVTKNVIIKSLIIIIIHLYNNNDNPMNESDVEAEPPAWFGPQMSTGRRASGLKGPKGPFNRLQNGPERAQRVEGPERALWFVFIQNGPERAQRVEGPERALWFDFRMGPKGPKELKGPFA